MSVRQLNKTVLLVFAALGPIYIQRLRRRGDITVTSLPNLIYSFGDVLLHWAFATATYFAVAEESLSDRFGSDVAAMS